MTGVEPEKPRRNGHRTAALLALIFAASACGQPEAPVYPARTPTRGTAVLPEAPELNPKLAPVHYDDDTWSVHGVLETAKQLPKEGVAVKGYVAALHTCPEDSKRCNPAPFVQLTDRENLQGRRLLVGGAIDADRDKLKIGQIATLRGRFATRSSDGLYFAPGGLLLFEPPVAEGDAPEGGEGSEKSAKSRSGSTNTRAKRRK